jgi:hypothetical protein
LVAWCDTRGGAYDIYAQRVTAGGTIAPGWDPNGNPLCTATSYQLNPIIVADGVGGAIVAWQDLRGGSNYDIYAQRVDPHGVVQWDANGNVVCAGPGSQEAPTIVADGVGGLLAAWIDSRSGPDGDIFGMHLRPNGDPRTPVVEVPLTPQFALRGVYPNPAVGDVAVAFSLPDASPARLEVFDVAGRRVAARDVGSLGGGSHTVRLAANRALGPGVYLLRLTRGGRSLTTRAVIVN